MHTRADYMDKRCTHADYYGEIAQAAGVSLVGHPIMPDVEKALAAGDEHLNSVPLDRWDSVGHGFRNALGPVMRARGDVLSMAGLVCVAKEAARQAAQEVTP